MPLVHVHICSLSSDKKHRLDYQQNDRPSALTQYAVQDKMKTCQSLVNTQYTSSGMHRCMHIRTLVCPNSSGVQYRPSLSSASSTPHSMSMLPHLVNLPRLASLICRHAIEYGACSQCNKCYLHVMQATACLHLSLLTCDTYNSSFLTHVLSTPGKGTYPHTHPQPCPLLPPHKHTCTSRMYRLPLHAGLYVHMYVHSRTYALRIYHLVSPPCM